MKIERNTIGRNFLSEKKIVLKGKLPPDRSRWGRYVGFAKAWDIRRHFVPHYCNANDVPCQRK